MDCIAVSSICHLDSIQTVLFYYKGHLSDDATSLFYQTIYSEITEMVLNSGPQSIERIQNFTNFLQTHYISDFKKDSAVYKEIRENHSVSTLVLLLQSLLQSPSVHVSFQLGFDCRRNQRLSFCTSCQLPFTSSSQIERNQKRINLLIPM